MSADFSLKGARFVVSDGDFYRVSQEFVDRIDTSVNQLLPGPISFPEYKSGDKGLWLLQTAHDLKDQFVHVDGELVRLEGETPF